MLALTLVTAAAVALTDQTVDRRLVVTMAPQDSEAVVLASPIGRHLMAYRFRLEAFDRTGRQTAIPATKALSIRVGTTAGVSEVELTHRAADYTVPRPFAIPLGADDSLVVSLAWIPDAAEGVSFRISIDYEPTATANTRLPVASVRAVAVATADPQRNTDVWHWQPTQSGRLLALSGLSRPDIVAVRLIDAVSGAVLWDVALGGPTVGGARNTELRLGVPVRAGHAYRIEVTYGSDVGPTNLTPESLMAVVLPSA